MRKQLPLLMLLATLLLTACGDSKLKNEATNITKEFFTAIKNEKKDQAKSIYPSIENLPSHYIPDSVTIMGTTISGDVVTVSIHARAAIVLNKAMERDMRLFFRKGANGKLELYDTKGFMILDEGEQLQKLYAIHAAIGCLNKSADTTDQQIITAVTNNKPVLQYLFDQISNNVISAVTIRNWDPVTLFGTLSARCTVCNNTQNTLHGIKYKLTFLNRDNVATHASTGYLTHDDVAPGECKSVAVMSEVPEGTASEGIAPYFDADFALDLLLATQWKGTECEEIKKQLATKH